MPALGASADQSALAGRLANGAGLRGRLRDATADIHRALDLRLSAFDLTRLSGYRRFLEASAAALLPLEAALTKANVALIFADWDRRSRRIPILADLAEVGGVLDPLPAPLLNRNTVLGTMYVLEGSRLGAKYLLRSISGSADPLIGAATAYLGHGAGQHLWQSFLAALEHEPVTPDDTQEAVEGARAAFAMFSKAAAIR